jgi:hypothetical protein
MTINDSESISRNKSHVMFLSGIRFISMKLFLWRFAAARRMAGEDAA